MTHPTEPSPGPAVRGRPGQSARAWGLWHAALPPAALLFFAGFLLGAALRPAALQGTAAGILLLLTALALGVFAKLSVKRLLRHQRGAEGEEKVARILDTLPAGWHVFHGVPLAIRFKGGRDADHIAVGPGGIFLIETVNWRGRISLRDNLILDRDQSYPGHTLEDFQAAAAELDDWLRESDPGLPSVIPVFCAAGGRYAPGMTARGDVRFREPATLAETLTRETASSLKPEQVERAAARLHELLDLLDRHA